MYYTGARPEELAGLALDDLREEPHEGWYLNIIDRPCAEDRDLFDDEPATKKPKRGIVEPDDGVPESHRRTLKTAASVRRVPVARELIELGFLRYVEWVRSSGSTVFFPTLRKDWHGKLSGSFGKFFGRYLRDLAITDRRKVLYSFRHNMKDLLEAAGFPPKYLRRFLGHTSGDGAVTDGYGSDVPFEVMAQHFARVRFPSIPALPWQPAQKSGRADRQERPARNRDEVPNISIG
jgi:integrase